MRRILWVLLAVIIILVGYVLIVKPVVVLPTVTVVSPENTTIGAYQRQLKINQLDLKLRTDGKLGIIGDGKELGYVSYNLATLKNGIDLGARVGLSRTITTAIRVVPIVFPQLAWSAFLTSQTVYFVLPVEMTVRFVQG